MHRPDIIKIIDLLVYFSFVSFLGSFPECKRRSRLYVLRFVCVCVCCHYGVAQSAILFSCFEFLVTVLAVPLRVHEGTSGS